MKSLSCVRLFATPWTVAYYAPPSMGFSMQEYWSSCHFLLQRIFLIQGSNPGLLHCRQTLYHLSHQGSLKGKLGLFLMGRAMLSKSLIQFSIDGRDCVPSLLFDLRPNYGGGNEDNGDPGGRPGFEPWVEKIPWRRKWQSTPVLLPGKSHGQRSLVGYSLWGRKELGTTE